MVGCSSCWLDMLDVAHFIGSGDMCPELYISISFGFLCRANIHKPNTYTYKTSKLQFLTHITSFAAESTTADKFLPHEPISLERF
jgi:hypothetical protein